MSNRNEVRTRLQTIAKTVDAQLPPGYGFVVFCFPFNAPPETRGEYCSNARRQDVIEMLKRWIADCPMPDPEKN